MDIIPVIFVVSTGMRTGVGSHWLVLVDMLGLRGDGGGGGWLGAAVHCTARWSQT